MYVRQLPNHIQEVLINRLVELNFTPEDIETALDSKVSDITEAALIDAHILYKEEEAAATVETDANYIIVTVDKDSKHEKEIIEALTNLGYRFIKSQGTFKKNNNLKQRTIIHELGKEFKIKFIAKEVK